MPPRGSKPGLLRFLRLSGASRQLCERSVGTEPLAYFLKFQFQRENAKPDRHSQRDGRKLKPNGSLLS